MGRVVLVFIQQSLGLRLFSPPSAGKIVRSLGIVRFVQVGVVKPSVARPENHMGLEMVEITMEVEEHFNVSLPESRVGGCRTYGDLLDLVVDVVTAANPVVDAIQIDAYLRQKLIAEYSIKAEHIVRDADLYGPNLNLG